MKSIILTISLALAISISQAQITLEHTYNAAVYTNGTYFFTFDGSTIKVYHSNHSLYKTVNTYPGIGQSVLIMNWGTTHLFNTDNKMEFLLLYFGGSTAGKVKVISDDGSVIKEFPNAESASVANVNGQGKLFVYYSNNSEVYSLPGTVPTSISKRINPITGLGNAYPNPAINTVKIPYNLPFNTTSTMYIYNAAGALMERLTITSEFNNILLDTSKYPAGTYYYKVGNKAKKMVIIR